MQVCMLFSFCCGENRKDYEEMGCIILHSIEGIKGSKGMAVQCCDQALDQKISQLK